MGRWWRILFWFLTIGLAGWVGYYFWAGTREPKVDIPMTGEFVTVEGSKIHIQTIGSGRVMLLLPGFPYTGDAFREYLNQPWVGYRLLAVDLPGLGLSEKLGPGPVTPDLLAMKIKLLLDRLEIKEADVVGHDLGGGVALILAANYPLLVKHLVLIAPDSSAGSAGDALGWWWRLPVLGPAWTHFRVHRDFIRDLLQTSWALNLPDWEDGVERYYLPLDSFESRQNFYALNCGRSHFDYLAYEEQNRVPTLVLWGAQDRVLPVSHGQALLQHLNQAQLQTIPGGGHLLLEETPQAVFEAIKKFLGPDDAPPVR